MVAFEDAEGFAEEVGLVEAVWGFGFYAVFVSFLISISGVGMGGNDGGREGRAYAWRSEAARLERTVFPMSTIRLRIF